MNSNKNDYKSTKNHFFEYMSRSYVIINSRKEINCSLHTQSM